MTLKDKLSAVLSSNERKIKEVELQTLQAKAFKQGRQEIDRCMADLFYSYLVKQRNELLDVGIEATKIQEYDKNQVILSKDEVKITISFGGHMKDEYKHDEAIYHGFVSVTEEAPGQVRKGGHLHGYRDVHLSLSKILNEKEYVTAQLKKHFSERDFENWLLKALKDSKMS